MTPTKPKLLLLICTISLIFAFPSQAAKASGKEFAISLLEVLNDIRVKPFEYMEYLEENFKILKRNVFNRDQTGASTDLDNNELLLKIDSEIKNLQAFLETSRKLSPLKKNKHLNRAARKLAKSNAKHSRLEYHHRRWEKEIKDLPNSKLMIERRKSLSPSSIINEQKNNLVSEIYQITGKFHLSFSNMLNCLLMLLSTSHSDSDLSAKRNLLFFSNSSKADEGQEPESTEGPAQTVGTQGGSLFNSQNPRCKSEWVFNLRTSIFTLQF